MVPLRKDMSARVPVRVHELIGEGLSLALSYPFCSFRTTDFLGGTVNEVRLEESSRICLAAISDDNIIQGIVRMNIPPYEDPSPPTIKSIISNYRNNPDRPSYYVPEEALKGIGSVLMASAAQAMIRCFGTLSPAYPFELSSRKKALGFYRKLGMTPFGKDLRCFKFEGIEMFEFLKRMYVKYPEPSKPNF